MLTRKHVAANLLLDLDGLFELLGIDYNDTTPSVFPRPPAILVSDRLDCARCGPDSYSLRKQEKSQKVRFLDEHFQWREADLFVSRCIKCRADYYPDCYTFPSNTENKRHQHLEIDCKFIRVSKHGVWVHRRVALAQEKAVVRFYAGWANFAEWINDTIHGNSPFTARQSKRLFVEHFSRRLLLAHSISDTFVYELALADGAHACMDCTHRKRYRSDLVEEGLDLAGSGVGVVEVDQAGDNLAIPLNDAPAENLLERPVQHNSPPQDTPRGYVRLAVMDGKSVGHRICALTTCTLPLQNYKNGRFCSEHAGLNSVCGIIPCERPVAERGELTCDNEAHRNWYRAYHSRFKRLTFPGVQRVLRRQGSNRLGEAHIPDHGSRPTLSVEGGLPPLNDTPGGEVVHTFRAQSVYCIQTVQWACGMPIGWGKCYRSESTPQVLAILDRIWEGKEEMKPSYLAYDDACDLLRHIVTQNAHSTCVPHTWLTSTKFIVDAWHYIGHRATDALCRLWCNPAPMDGSQPDLIIGQEDASGRVHATRAFNTETAEQLNSWITRYEAQLRQMTDVSFDFFVHVLLLLYGETIETRIARKERVLSPEFWDGVLDVELEFV
ncbi:hypothetical protein FA13DRAFT_1758075 [Coprinellus micaceus]|uniref:CxC5 like cysteine cluster associated with KDZ domain-containing protein n=1 Tax=Coprinellus micaceus TaxID=71717 RepID=A0A4Y7SF81_COPMI|nr:hypothetical protein FA13DRAFT_1758075 [Coprinellus micaceus]